MTTMTSREPGCRRGDVALVLFPDSNLRTAKLRPVLVIQSDDLRTDLPQVIVAMITSKSFRAGHPSRVMILRATAEGRQSGLLTDSVVMADNLATISDSEIHRVVGSLPMDEVETALRHTLAL
jgi:mRNA interferase MazF